MHRHCVLDSFPNLTEDEEREKTRCQCEDVQAQSIKEWYSRLDIPPPLKELMTGLLGDLELPYS